MIIIVQLIIIAIAIFMVVATIGNRSTHSGKAWKKISLMLLAVCMIVAVIFPNSTNDLAHLVGVGRGADLLLYATVVAFILYALNNYLHQQDQRDALFRLARRIAMNEAKEKYTIGGDYSHVKHH